MAKFRYRHYIPVTHDSVYLYEVEADTKKEADEKIKSMIKNNEIPVDCIIDHHYEEQYDSCNNEELYDEKNNQIELD